MLASLGLVFFLTCFSSFSFEYVQVYRMRHHGAENLLRLSHILTRVADYTYLKACALGAHIARLSSFLSFIDLTLFDEVWRDLVGPTSKLLMTPLWIIYGYVDELRVFQSRWFLVVLGTLLCMVGMWVGFIWILG